MTLISGKIRLAVTVLLVFLLAEASAFALISSPVYIQNQGRIVWPLVSGLPSADVYVVPIYPNYVILNGSNPYQVLETDSDPVVAVTHALSKWCPTNGKLVTNGTLNNWQTTLHLKNNVTWEGWKTVINITGDNGDHGTPLYLSGVSYNSINNLTVLGNHIMTYGAATYGGTPCDYNNITHCTFTGFIHGLTLGSNNHWIISYNNLSFNYDPTHSSNGDGIDFHGAYNTIANNTIDCGGIIGTGGIVDGGGHNIIENNTILDWTSGVGLNTHGIYSSASPYDEIAWNNLTSTVSDDSTTGSAALHMKSDHLYIHDNYIKVAGDMIGISTYNESDGPVGERCINNTIVTISDSQTAPHYGPCAINIGGGNNYGDYCSDMWFENNTISGYWETDLFIWHPDLTAYPVNNVTFTGNTFLNGHSVCQIGASNYPADYVQNVYFYNNTFSNIDGHCYYFWGVTFEIYPGDKNITIHDNAFSNCVTSLSTSIIDCSFSNTNLMAASVIYNNTGLQTGSYPFYMLNVSSVGSGTTSPHGLGWQYVSGTSISISYIPNSTFLYWVITTPNLGTKYSNPISITVNQSYVLTGYGS